MLALVAMTTANIKQDLKLAIKTQWHLRAATSVDSLNQFNIMWCKHYGNTFVEIDDHPHAEVASFDIKF